MAEGGCCQGPADEGRAAQTIIPSINEVTRNSRRKQLGYIQADREIRNGCQDQLDEPSAKVILRNFSTKLRPFKFQLRISSGLMG